VDLSTLTTEQRNPDTLDIDRMSSLEIVTTMNRQDALAPAAIQPCLPVIAALVDRIVEAILAGGRLIYIGAGTSGRLGVLDASECPPTYGVDPGLVVGLIAGGDHALRHAVEGAEDDAELGARDLKAIDLNAGDVVVGIAASGRTPYTLGAMRYAKEMGAMVGCVVNTPDSAMAQAADYPIVVRSGPEVVTGSTRLKSGTAQKLVLNMLSTAAMIRLGKVYSNLMVDVQASNAKLVQRATNIVREVTGVSQDEARCAIERYSSAKLAIFALLSKIESDEAARTALAAHGGRLRDALAATQAASQR
jgi:N-acetylmuramic acid 6-phosphate etherase